MDAKQAEFLKRLREMFRVEADEHIRAISSGLIELEKAADTPQRAELIETLFREAHSLKGAARSVSLQDIESVCQAMESTFAALKRRELAPSTALCDVAHQAVDAIAQRVVAMDAESSPAERARTRELVEQLRQVSEVASVAASPGVPTGGAAKIEPLLPPSPPIVARPDDGGPSPSRTDNANRMEGGRSASTAVSGECPVPSGKAEASRTDPSPPSHSSSESSVLLDTVRISTGRLEPLLAQAEELTLARMAAVQRVADMREVQRALAAWRTELTRWQDRRVIGGERRATDVLTWNETLLGGIQTRVAAVTVAMEHDLYALGRMVDEHLEAMKSVLMLPVSSLTQGFPKLVRDLAREQGKDVELLLRGEDLEMDKRILEELKDPLIHILRNSIDHGVEKPDLRTGSGKPPRATVTVTFKANQARQAEIVISDDGAGMDPDALRSAAVKGGILSPEAAGKIPVQELVTLAFHSGISTNAMITDISGRGLGLAIVREKVEKLGGVVSVSTEPHAGTTFRLLVPLTLATFNGILVRVQDQVFVLPGGNVERVARVLQREVKTVENKATIRNHGHVLALVKLADVLDMPPRPSDAKPTTEDVLHVLMLTSGETSIALQVDEILDEQDVLVKGLGPQLTHVRGIAGATILGSGKVAPVLNVSDLIQSAARTVAAAAPTTAPMQQEERPGRILVAEDSITSRALLKNILESGGYHVAVAVDGMDAFTQLRSDTFDLVVSDVDMPRMNGFELTGRIRADRKFAETPVILVTSLDSREDREHGVDVGANAYIIKSSFEQSNLLEAVRRLI